MPWCRPNGRRRRAGDNYVCGLGRLKVTVMGRYMEQLTIFILSVKEKEEEEQGEEEYDNGLDTDIWAAIHSFFLFN
ncbi:hypothetical protein BLOT_001240 [Blomia tropicalis]|nr:hypothetical protein BLOT_001240 [Blomia tropicalis]